MPDIIVLGVHISYWLTTFVVGGVAALVCSKLMSWWRLIQHKRQLQRVFDGPPPHWLTGNLREMAFFGKGYANMLRWAKTYGDALLVYVGPLARIECIGHNTARAVLNTNEPKPEILFRFIQPWIGDGLLVSKGAKWARNRRLLTPAFHFDVLKDYVAIFSDSANTLTLKWNTLSRAEPEKKLQLEMFQHISLMTLEALMKCIFGIETDCQSDGCRHPYIQGVHDISDLIIKRFHFLPFHNNLIFALSRSGWRFRQACNVVHRYSRDIILQRKQKRAAGKRTEETPGGGNYRDFMDILLEARDEDGVGLTDSEIQQEIDTFMFEGHDTTASGMSWCLYNLARHAEYQQKCRDEINEILGDHSAVNWDDAQKMTYLTMCIKESLRLHPPVPGIGRQLESPLQLHDGRTIPAGSWVGVQIYLCHHDPKVWPEPEVYDPDRFSVENAAKRSSHAFIPFSAGPRNCIGQQFAMLEMKTSLAVLLRRFSFQLVHSEPPVLVPQLILRAQSGLWLDVQPLAT